MLTPLFSFGNINMDLELFQFQIKDDIKAAGIEAARRT
jgi:hypothetical protein